MTLNIKEMRFEDLTADKIESFSKYYKINWKWFGPQLLAELGAYDYQNTCGDENGDLTLEGLEYFLESMTPRMRGLMLFATNPRTKCKGFGTHTWTESDLLPYCGLVPLFLAAQKKFNGLSYSKWYNLPLDNLVEPNLLKPMQY